MVVIILFFGGHSRRFKKSSCHRGVPRISFPVRRRPRERRAGVRTPRRSPSMSGTSFLVRPRWRSYSEPPSSRIYLKSSLASWKAKRWRQVSGSELFITWYKRERQRAFRITHSLIAGGLACVQLLICQMAPVLRKMQKSVADRVQGRESPFNSNFAGSVENTFLSQLPSIEELRDYGHECEKRYSACDLSAIGGRWVGEYVATNGLLRFDSADDNV